MRTEADLRQKIRKLEASTAHINWDEELLERETKVISSAKIWGILYALGYAEEEVTPIGFGELDPSRYGIISDDPE